MSDFKVFSKAVHARYEEMAAYELFVVDVEDVFASYLAAYPEGTNPIFRERTVHDCNCCKQFIRKLGVLVGIDEEGKVKTVWDGLKLPSPYKEVAERMAQIVRQAPIKTVFRTKERQYGMEHNYDTKTNERWNHFYGRVADRHFAAEPDTKRGEKEATFAVLKRGLDELKVEDLETVLDLTEDNRALYRGAEHREAVNAFLQLKKRYDSFPGSKDVFAWASLGSRHARFRNTVIGTLLVDLADGRPLEDAVRVFEAKVAPTNYKRTTALITPRMVDDAVKTLNKLGLEGAVHRRFARLSDVSVNNVLFVDNGTRGKMKDGVAGLLASSVKTPDFDARKGHIPMVTADEFVGNILPKAKAVSVFVENRHASNFVSLTGGDGPERLFRWDNNFAWSYEGEVADSVKARVKAAGGNVNAKLRVSLAWYNYDDLDIHCVTPTRQHICYADKAGILDVDMNAAGRRDSRTPVENLAFNQLMDGVYKVSVNNYAKQENVDHGFTVEVEFAGVLQQFSYAKAVPDKKTVDALALTVKNGALVEVGVCPGLVGGSVSSDKWGVKTETLVPVTILLNSPNHWDGHAVGNKHWFFMLDGCKNPDAVRGIYNEFLRPDLEKHRKVFEVLGSKTKCQPTEDQISGVGFSSGRGDTVTVVVDGKRAYNINF